MRLTRFDPSAFDPENPTAAITEVIRIPDRTDDFDPIVDDLDNPTPPIDLRAAGPLREGNVF